MHIHSYPMLKVGQKQAYEESHIASYNYYMNVMDPHKIFFLMIIDVLLATLNL